MNSSKNEKYIVNLKRLGNELMKQIVDERKRFIFVGGFSDVYPPSTTLFEMSEQSEIIKRNLNRQGITEEEIKIIILEMRRILYELRQLRYEFESVEDNTIYEFMLAEYVANKTHDGSSYPEDTSTEDIRILPDSGFSGGKSKRKRKKKVAKKTLKLKK